MRRVGLYLSMITCLLKQGLCICQRTCGDRQNVCGDFVRYRYRLEKQLFLTTAFLDSRKLPATHQEQCTLYLTQAQASVPLSRPHGLRVRQVDAQSLTQSHRALRDRDLCQTFCRAARHTCRRTTACASRPCSR